MKKLLHDGRVLIANGECVQIGGEVIMPEDLPAVEKFLKDAKKFKVAVNADNTGAATSADK